MKRTSVFLFGLVFLAVMLVAPFAMAYRTSTQDTYLYNMARKTYLTWEELLVDQRTDMAAKADAYQANINTYTTPYDQIADVWWWDYTRSSAARYEQLGDSATHTGEYLAGLAAKYAVTGDAATLADINTYLNTFAMLAQCTGRTGYVARFAGPASDPAYQPYYQNYGNGYGNCVAPWTGWVWLDWSSRDTYFGTAFGLGAVWKNVNDAATRDWCRQIVEVIVDRLSADSWWIKSPSGKQTNPTTGMKLVWKRLALSVNPSKYSGLQSGYNSDYTWWNLFEKPNVSDKYKSDYFTHNLNFMYMYVLTALETNTTKYNTYKDWISQMHKNQSIDHLQPLYSSLYAAARMDPYYTQTRATSQGMLLDYPAPPRWMHAVNVSGNPIYQPQRDGTFMTYAIHHIEDRPTDIYLWQRSPCIFAGGADTSYEHPGHDFFTAYWFGRLGGVIPAP